jgi:hypothetical protein
MLKPVQAQPRRSSVVWAVLIAICVSGCGQLGLLPFGDRGSARAHQQAQEALDRWAAAVAAAGEQQAEAVGFVPVGELTGQIGDWEEVVGDNNKRALYAGMLAPVTELPTDSPGDGQIRWEDGRSKAVHTITAAQALQDLKAAATAPCADCQPIQVTDARLSEATVATSRGPATAPAWEFVLAGTRVVVTRIAVAAPDQITVTPPPWDSNDPPVGVSIESATGTVGGRQLTVAFTGPQQGADKPCGSDYTTEAVESSTAIVVIVIEHANLPMGAACDLVGYRREATVELAAPLADRTVLEVRQGLPVPITLTP